MRVSWRLLRCWRGKHSRSRRSTHEDANGALRSACRYCGIEMERDRFGDWWTLDKRPPDDAAKSR